MGPEMILAGTIWETARPFRTPAALSTRRLQPPPRSIARQHCRRPRSMYHVCPARLMGGGGPPLTITPQLVGQHYCSQFVSRDLNWRPPQIRTPTTQPASALPGVSGTATASPKQKREPKKNRISPPHLVHVRAEGVLGRGRNFRPL